MATDKKDELQAAQNNLKFCAAMIVTLILLYALIWIYRVNSRLDSLEERADETEMFDLLNQFP